MVPRVGLESCNYHFTFDTCFVLDTVALNSVISGKADYWPAAILGALAKQSRQATTLSLVTSVCMEHRDSHRVNFREISYFVYLLKCIETFRFF
jgi:hypothetical protein